MKEEGMNISTSPIVYNTIKLFTNIIVTIYDQGFRSKNYLINCELFIFFLQKLSLHVSCLSENMKRTIFQIFS